MIPVEVGTLTPLQILSISPKILVEVCSHSPEPRKCLCKLFIQLLHTLLVAYLPYRTYSLILTGDVWAWTTIVLVFLPTC